MLESSLPSQVPADGSKPKSPTSSPTAMPPQSHTLLDLLVTLSPYLPSSSFPMLFSVAAKILPLSSDPQLQKKAYKLLPKLATTDVGAATLQARSADVQNLLLETAASATTPCRHDRINALATVVRHLPSEDLHFIPSILSEIVIATKETNEKARLAAFDNLILMAEAMSASGGIVKQARIPHMPSNAPTTKASLEEFFTMLAAGLGGDTPHMISASITALTRVLYDYHARLPSAVLEELVGAMSLFLENPNREIVRSVLGFMKVAIISLPVEIIQPKLATLVPGLMRWSKEHKSHFRVKVKNILERAMRRFGTEVIEKVCPEQDRNLVKNIRKSRERNKRKKKEGGVSDDEGGDDDDSENGKRDRKRRARFTNAFDAEVYGSDSENSSTASDNDTSRTQNQSQASQKVRQRSARERPGARKRGTYIHEATGDGNDDPLDLTSTSALGHISSSIASTHHRASSGTQRKQHKGKVNIDGKLVIGMDDDDDDNNNTIGKNNDAMVIDNNTSVSNANANANAGGNNVTAGASANAIGGIDAYVSAIRGRDSVQRGRGGRLKFDNKRKKRTGEDVDGDGDAMDIDKGKGAGSGGGVMKGKKGRRLQEGDRVNGLRIHRVGGAKGGGAAADRKGGSGAVRGGRIGKMRAGAGSFVGRRSGGGGRGGGSRGRR